MMHPLKGYEGKYWINESGVIINKKGHKMRTAVSNSGYLRVALEEKDSTHRRNESIHRLVAQEFIPNPNNYPVVMHIDDDRLNNHVSNLKWGTYSENVQQSVKEGTFGRMKNQYEIFNQCGDSIICKNREEVADTIGYETISLKNMVGNGRKIALGPYKGYMIRRITKEEIKGKIIKPVYFFK